MKLVYLVAFVLLLLFMVVAVVNPSGYDIAGVVMGRVFVLLVYVIAINAIVTDPFLSGVEKGLCVAAVLIGSFFGMGIVGFYMSYQTKKRFKLNFGGEEGSE